MKLRAAALAATATLATPAAADPASVPASNVGRAIRVHRRCSRTFTARMFDRAARRVYAGTTLPDRGAYRHLWHYARCQRPPSSEQHARALWHRHLVAWVARRQAASDASMSTAVASWYLAAGGPIACGGDSYAMGVANKTLPCGTRLLICYARCVQAVVFDRGPFVAGRDFDLSGAVKDATGFPDGVATIRYRIGYRMGG